MTCCDNIRLRWLAAKTFWNPSRRRDQSRVIIILYYYLRNGENQQRRLSPRRNIIHFIYDVRVIIIVLFSALPCEKVGCRSTHIGTLQTLAHKQAEKTSLRGKIIIYKSLFNNNIRNTEYTASTVLDNYWGFSRYEN